MKSSFMILIATIMVIGAQAKHGYKNHHRGHKVNQKKHDRKLQVSSSFEIGNSTISGSLATNDDNYTIQGLGNGTYNNGSQELNYSYVMNTQIINNNHTFTTNTTFTTEAIIKFDKYFYYSIDNVNVKNTSVVAHCQKETQCNIDSPNDYCCANAIIRHPGTGQHTSLYRCINQRVADMNWQVRLGDMQISLRCLGVRGAVFIKTAVTALTIGALSVISF